MARSGLTFDHGDGETLVVRLAGPWQLQSERPPFSEFEDALASSPQTRKIAFDPEDLGAWDTGLLIFLKSLSIRTSALSGPAPDGDDDAIVTALIRTVADLSREIAGELRRFEQERSR